MKLLYQPRDTLTCPPTAEPIGNADRGDHRFRWPRMALTDSTQGIGLPPTSV